MVEERETLAEGRPWASSAILPLVLRSTSPSPLHGAKMMESRGDYNGNSLLNSTGFEGIVAFA
jgi:hypothetical protein